MHIVVGWPLTLAHTELLPAENEVKEVLHIKRTQFMKTIHSILNWVGRNMNRCQYPSTDICIMYMHNFRFTFTGIGAYYIHASTVYSYCSSAKHVKNRECTDNTRTIAHNNIFSDCSRAEYLNSSLCD